MHASLVPAWPIVKTGLPPETLLLPRLLVNQLLHQAQSSHTQMTWGIIAALDDMPGHCYPLAQNHYPAEERISVALKMLAHRGERLWAVYRTDSGEASAPAPAELTPFGARLFLAISLGTKGVLQLAGWRMDNSGILELEVAICETQT